MSGSLQGKVAIITGAASGIGAATSEMLARRGAAVVVADEAQVSACVQTAARELGRLDIMHNNAAAVGLAHVDGGLLDQTVENWEAAFRVNVLGVMLGCKHAVPIMLEQGSGSIINT